MLPLLFIGCGNAPGISRRRTPIGSVRVFKLSVGIVDMTAMIDANSQTAILARLMDAASLRNEVIAHNVANVNTPGHLCLTVQFEDAFAQALASGNGTRALQVTPQVVAGGGGVTRTDGNNVDIDLEMNKIAKNSLLYEFCAQVMAVQIAQQRSAIQGR
jgi:flagellar basal-body rod protein FlgB